MTLTRPNLLKLLLPLAVFCALLAALTAVNGSDAPELGAPGVDLAAPSGDAVRGLPARRAGRPRQRRRLRRARRGVPSARSRDGRSVVLLARRPLVRRGAAPRPARARRPDRRRRARRPPPRLPRAAAPGHRGAPGGPRPGAAPDRGGRRSDRAGPLRRRRAVDPAPPRHEAGPRLVLARLVPARAERRPGRRRRGDAAGGGGRRRRAREPRVRPGSPGRPRASARTAGRGARRLPGRAPLRARASRRRWWDSRAWMPLRGRLGPAIARLRRATQLLPLTTSLTLLADLELAAGRDRQAAADLAAARAERRLYRSAGTAPDAEAVLFEAQHGDPRVAVADGAPRLGSGPERALGRRARLGAHQGRAGRPPGCIGRTGL